MSRETLTGKNRHFSERITGTKNVQNLLLTVRGDHKDFYFPLFDQIETISRIAFTKDSCPPFITDNHGDSAQIPKMLLCHSDKQ